MKGFIAELAGIVLLSVAAEMIMPKGSVKKYLKLTIGFIMMIVLIKPFTVNFEIPKFKLETEDALGEEELNARSDAIILDLHKRNLERKVKEICGEEVMVYIELFSDGNVKSVKVICRREVFSKREVIAKELGCSNVEMAEE